MAYDREGVGTVAAAVHIVFAVASLITFVGFWTLFVLDRWHRTQRTGVHAALRFLGVVSSSVSVLFWIDPNSTWRMSPFWVSYILQAAQTGLASTTLVYVAWLTDKVWRKSLSLPESRWMRVISLVLGGLVAVNNTVLGILSGALLPQCCVPQTVMLLVWSSAMLVFTFIWVVSLIRLAAAVRAADAALRATYDKSKSLPPSSFDSMRSYFAFSCLCAAASAGGAINSLISASRRRNETVPFVATEVPNPAIPFGACIITGCWLAALLFESRSKPASASAVSRLPARQTVGSASYAVGLGGAGNPSGSSPSGPQALRRVDTGRSRNGAGNGNGDGSGPTSPSRVQRVDTGKRLETAQHAWPVQVQVQVQVPEVSASS